MIGSTLSDRAAVSSEGICVDAGAVSGLNMITARLSRGAISESSSSHLPTSVASVVAKPVTFPDRFLPAFSASYANSIGISCMACFPRIEFWKRMGSIGEGA